MSVSAPYRFVPLSSLIVFPDWADQVSHDRPFSDGISGELNIQIHNTSPLCVGGKQDKSSEHQAGKIHFYRSPDNTLAIPGSSLKGMLRNVVEIASFSRFKQVEDQKLGVRDISEANNFYAQAMRNPNAGWLNFRNGKWTITPCGFVRVHQEQIIKHYGIPYTEWESAKSVRKRYSTKIGTCPKVHYEVQAEERNGKRLGNLLQSGGETGHLVMTGQPGRGFQGGLGAKKYEFIFQETKQEDIPISQEVMSGFMQIHESTDEWRFWFPKLGDLELGIPVFWHKEGSQVRSLGLAMMYKVAYKNSLHDAIGNTSDKHLNTHLPDMADLIFGYISDAETPGSNVPEALRGRVNILTAHLDGKQPALSLSQNTVLSAPKPTYYPLYVRQDSDAYNQLMQKSPRLSGWKRYHTKPANIVKAPDDSSKKAQVQLEQLAEGHQFDGKIVFHNLRPVELGALVWALGFGGRNKLRHSLGMGKPYGLGQLRIEVGQARLRRNDQHNSDNTTAILDACQMAFESYMNETIKMVSVQPTAWLDSGEMKALLEYATPSEQSDSFDYPSKPDQYAKARKVANLQGFIQTFHSHKPTEFDDNAAVHAVPNIDLAQWMQTAADKQAKQAAQANREQQKGAASTEEQSLMELEDYLSKFNDGTATGSAKKNAAKFIKTTYDEQYPYFDEEQQQRFWSLGEQINAIINDNATTKLLKKRDTQEAN